MMRTRPGCGRARRRATWRWKPRHARLSEDARHAPRADEHQEIRDAVRQLCRQFPDGTSAASTRRPRILRAFVDALIRAGWLSAMIPEEYGGTGLGLAAATVIMEEINRSGGNAGAVHGQMYNMGTLLRHGSAAQKARYLPRSPPAGCASSRWR